MCFIPEKGLDKHQGQILRLRSSKGQKGKKKKKCQELMSKQLSKGILSISGIFVEL